jgi:26S proteasome regulatory subunit T2
VKKKGLDGQNRLPNVAPASKCMLRKLKLDRVKDWLLMEEEFVANQARAEPSTLSPAPQTLNPTPYTLKTTNPKP